MEQHTTYRAKGKTIGLIFLFKYDLNGNLKAFQIEQGQLNGEQMKWLFSHSNFPADESIIRSLWMKDEKYTKVFIVEVSPADLSFEALWNLYNKKESRKDAEKIFAKLKESDIIKCFLQVPIYKKKIAQSGVAQALLSTWLNKERFNDEYSSEFKVGKVFNPALHELANKKTSK